MYQVVDPFDGPSPDTWRCQVHRGCIHNECTALLGRVLGAVPEPSPSGIASLSRGVRRITRILKARNTFERCGYDTIIRNYSGSKRTRYERAAERLADQPVSKRDARVTMFIKAEKRKESDLKDPRAIQFRTPEYNLELATFLKPIEHAILAYKGVRRGVRKSFVIAKGRDSFERAALIRSKWNQFGDPVCVSLDASRFDKHVSAKALQAEHSCYNSIWNNRYLAQLLAWQVSNKGRSMNGIKYSVRGNRMSGDYNTGMGNCLLVAAMTEEWLLGQGVKFDYFADSDDCLVFCERSDLEQLLKSVGPTFLEFGQEVVLENVAYELQDIRHCQCAPMETAAGFRMVRDWRKVVSQAFSGFNHYHEPRGGMRVLKSIAQCELVLNTGVPVLQPMAVHMLSLLEAYRFAKLDQRDTVVWLAGVEVRKRALAWTDNFAVPITQEARFEFERVFGLTPEQQCAWETWFERLTFNDIDLSRMAFVVPPVDQHYY